jgi:hypothetical protein
VGRPVVPDGSLEALKWIGLLAMTGDHIDKYLLNSTLTPLFDAGRLAAPLFIFVLACNLARPGAVERGTYRRTIGRLAVSGIGATPIFVGLGGLWHGWWPGNILLSLLVLTGVLALLDRQTAGTYALAGTVFVVGGSSVEFWWPGLALGVGTWWYCRQPGWMPTTLAVGGVAGLYAVNGNFWAMGAVPLVLGAAKLDLRVPRVKWLFYIYYPLHLGVILAIKVQMGKAGYLFFY